MQELIVHAGELDSQSATLLPDRETLCYAGCVNVQLNMSAITAVQIPISISIGGDATALAQSYIDTYQINELSY